MKTLSIKAYAELTGKTENWLIQQIRDGEAIGYTRDGEWFIQLDDEPGAEKPAFNPRKHNAGIFGGLLGGAAAAYLWFVMNMLEYNIRHVNLYHALTSPELMASNGFNFHLETGMAAVLAGGTILIAALIVGGFFRLIAR